MTAFTVNTLNSPGAAALLVSDIVTVATPIAVDLSRDFGDKTHVQAGVEFFADATGTPATAGAGTITFTARTLTCPGTNEALGSSTITAATPKTLGWDFSFKSITATPTGVTTATHWRLNLVLADT